MKKFFKFTCITLTILCISGFFVLYFLPKPSLLQGIGFSKTVYDEHRTLLRMTLSHDEKYRVYTPLDEISRELISATLLQEDYYFRWHFGINPWSLFKAMWQTYAVKSRRVGASTITMQLARLLYGMNSKKIDGKLIQMIRAVQIEMNYSKDEILEAYLNLAPYGGNIEGVGAASLIYFNHKANKLTLPEALTLSVIPQNPGKRTPNNHELKRIRTQLSTRWLRLHPKDIDKKMMFELPLVMNKIAQLPFSAPHLVNTILKNETTLNQRIISTTIDYKTQRLIERMTHQYLARKKNLRVNNASVLLVDTRDMGVKAWLGSADFFNKNIQGQINGVDIKRSPGSTLKPFIYGLAIDEGLIHPNTVLKDVPQSFNGYNPENFDYDFMGPIKAKDALVLSRNIPVIYLSSQLSSLSLHEFLARAKVSSLKSESYYGLSINLGGAELTMRELVGLYAMLVNDGVWYPIRLKTTQPHAQGIRLLSPEASFLVLDMLKNTPRLDASFASSHSLAVAWKTGTSSGYRDAWTIGTFGPYVLAVWIGNFDNKANPAFIGKDIAAPLFFELINAMKHEQKTIVTLDRHPELMHLKKIKVCRASGMLPTRFCKDREWTWFIPGKSPIKRDTIYREVAINEQTGLRTCHIDEHTRFEVFEFWSTDLLRIFKRAGIQRHTPPFFEADCTHLSGEGLSPHISSPEYGVEYVLQADSPLTNTIPLTAVTDSGISHVYWFINEQFIAKAKADEPYLWEAKPGKYIVRVVDSNGLSDARKISILMDK